MLVSILALVTFSLACAVYRRWRRISISDVPGPECKSFLYGNLPEFLGGQAGDMRFLFDVVYTDFEWRDKYGDVFKIRGPLGAIQYIYHTASYRFPKAEGRRQISHLLFGPGLSNVDGDVHKRQRKDMLPGFGGPESKAFSPDVLSVCREGLIGYLDSGGATHLSADQSIVLDVTSWISRATLDAIAAFDYSFGALDDSDNQLTKAYANLFSFDIFGIPTEAAILSLSVMDHLPPAMVAFLMRNFPGRLSHGLLTNKLSTAIAKDLGKGRRDIMSLLVEANASENAKTRLPPRELFAQMNTIILAGHETTSNTLCFGLLEFCKHPEIQQKLRREIHAAERAIRNNGRTESTASDLDSMPYLSAVVKETLRYHAVVYNVFRVSSQDDVLPLNNPITTTSGKVLHELPIPKGLQIISSVAAYNRVCLWRHAENKEIFGDDADVFNPERWLRESVPKTTASLGVYGSLFTFAGGARSCIGWRFAVLEMHMFLIQLVGNFEFSLAEDKDIRREATFVMTPKTEGEIEKGSLLRLKIKVAQKEE
ncbi:cytochrome P450 [Desarmillaria tabescens]|uniref:Cytochrome P450 n=1 Tax=Armillaria tabescens TaxID=1929756 RepID=A0AA39K1T2_ARMTA|nr:cytochrome P450 [Desarmillaria tabescens]KAK0452757.1 cytochrome P450 [Desarmillaria tabescens]